MAVSLTHTTQATGADAGNGEIRKAQWNEAHTLTMAADFILGRATAGNGAVEEIACTAAGRALLDDANAAAQRTTLGVDAAGTDNSTPVTLAGSGTYLSLTGQQITVDSITVSDISDIAANYQPLDSVLTNTTASFTTADETKLDNAREALTADRDYYVRTDGSNSNDGLTDSSGGAFLTVNKAIDTVAALDLSIYHVTINLGNGTYTDQMTFDKSWVGGTGVTIVGDNTTPSNVLVSTTAAHLAQITVPLPSPIKFDGFKLQTTGSTDGIRIEAPCKVLIGNLDFGTIGGSGIHAFSPGANILHEDDYSITGNCARHWNIKHNSFLRCTGKTITLTGTPAFSAMFARGDTAGGMVVSGNTFSGSATGKRYEATFNGSINVNGGGASYLPGDVAGTTATGGEYA